MVFPEDMQCLYRDCHSTSFLPVPVTADCPLGRICDELYDELLPQFCWMLIKRFPLYDMLL